MLNSIRYKIFIIILTVATAFIFGGLATNQSVARQAADNFGALHEPGQVLIKLKNSEKIYNLQLGGQALEDFIQTNQKNKSIDYLEPNYIYHAVIEPNDGFYTQQIYLSAISAPQAWNYTTGYTPGSKNVVIAIIDSGVDVNHPDLVYNIWQNSGEIKDNHLDDDGNGYIDDYNGWDFILNQPDPSPKFDGDYSFLGINHGTIIAGVAAAQGNNNQGIAGVSWHAKIMSLRVLGGDGSGNTLDVARAIDYAREKGAQIINLSFVGEGRSATLEDAIARAYQAGVLVVAAAGNEVTTGLDMTTNPRYPVCHDGGPGNNWVIGVASVDNNNQLASFSNYGNCVDLIAPGVGIFSTLDKNDSLPKYNREYGGYWSGTSVSAPQVVGVAALVKALKPELSLMELRDLLLNNADNIDNKNWLYVGKMGHGKLNGYKVLAAANSTVSAAEVKIDKIIFGPGQKGGPHIRVYSEGKFSSQFFAFEETKRAGANVASFDFNHDGQEEIIVGANGSEEPWVKIFDLRGNLKLKFLAFDSSMKKGIRLAVGDIDNDKQAEIIVVAQTGFEPVVKIFSETGSLIKEFYAVNKFFTGGLNVAVGDVNGDSYAEIVVATGAGTSGLIKIFNYTAQTISQFIPYDSNYMRGLTVAVGDITGNGQKEIITAPAMGGSPQVRTFDWQGRAISQFFAYNEKFFGGVNLASGDVNGDGLDEIITGAGPGGGPHVRVFNARGLLLNQFFAYSEKFTGGVYVASGK